MDTIRNSITKNFKIFFFSISITSGMYIAIQELHEYGNKKNFLFFSIALLGIFFVEAFSNWYEKRSSSSVPLDRKIIEDDLKHLLHRILLPILLYCSIIGYSYYNLKSYTLYLVLVMSFFIFFVLFTNIRYFLDNNAKAESKTHYIFDIIKFLIFFTSINILSHLDYDKSKYEIFYFIGVFALTLTIETLMVWRLEKLHKWSFIYSVLVAIFVCFTFYLAQYQGKYNPLHTSLILVCVFYIASALTHHKLINTLTRAVLIEYLVVLSLVLTISYGIN
jgi:hypothetical protein